MIHKIKYPLLLMLLTLAGQTILSQPFKKEESAASILQKTIDKLKAFAGFEYRARFKMNFLITRIQLILSQRSAGL